MSKMVDRLPSYVLDDVRDYVTGNEEDIEEKFIDDVINDMSKDEVFRAYLGRVRAEKFKEVYGSEWESYDTHGYVQAFLDGKFVF